ncbi:hypothetical protein AG1IA_01169 [Rhizoctonia solani AG-1 IA]|uniref:Uncharacterized protein n=1 Tax=Thanatephorus cucumeris (strain AG1-IA) TaxID=983506 RepID=L8X3F2_THACA|nr:hypothetical protein AG1IA_01169 [Rhizoctonia solani AG-1 IA]
MMRSQVLCVAIHPVLRCARRLIWPRRPCWRGDRRREPCTAPQSRRVARMPQSRALQCRSLSLCFPRVVGPGKLNRATHPALLSHYYLISALNHPRSRQTSFRCLDEAPRALAGDVPECVFSTNFNHLTTSARFAMHSQLGVLSILSRHRALAPADCMTFLGIQLCSKMRCKTHQDHPNHHNVTNVVLDNQLELSQLETSASERNRRAPSSEFLLAVIVLSCYRPRPTLPTTRPSSIRKTHTLVQSRTAYPQNPHHRTIPARTSAHHRPAMVRHRLSKNTEPISLPSFNILVNVIDTVPKARVPLPPRENVWYSVLYQSYPSPYPTPPTRLSYLDTYHTSTNLHTPNKMHIPDPVILHLSKRDPSFNADQTRTIAWVVCIIVAAVLIIGIWCAFKLWGSRARNFYAEQDLGVRSLPPPQPRSRRWGGGAGGGARVQPQEEFLPVYDSSGRPPAFSPPGMPPPAYLPGDALGRETYRRDGVSRELGSIEEKDEPEEGDKKEVSADDHVGDGGERKERRWYTNKCNCGYSLATWGGMVTGRTLMGLYGASALANCIIREHGTNSREISSGGY